VARKGRLSALTRALRELEMQRLLMGKGAKKSLMAKKSTTRDIRDEEPEKGDLPEAEEGIASGARVWVSFFPFIPSSPFFLLILVVGKEGRADDFCF
jgi:hypothetical protein